MKSERSLKHRYFDTTTLTIWPVPFEVYTKRGVLLKGALFSKDTILKESPHRTFTVEDYTKASGEYLNKGFVNALKLGNQDCGCVSTLNKKEKKFYFYV